MKFKILLFICLLQGSVFAQNHQRFAQMNFAQGIMNPAALAIDAEYQVDLMFRNQWFQFDGAPTTFAANGQYELDFDMAVGLNFYHDRIGASQANAFSGQYAYRLHFDKSNALILGLGIGMESKTSDYAGATLNQPGDPAFAQSYSKVFFNSSVGVYYYSPMFYIGASIPQMFQTNFGSSDGFNIATWHYYASTGAYLDAGDNYTFNPNLQVKMVRGAPIQGDLILRNTFYGRFSIVAGFSSEIAIIAGVDMMITPFLRAGYSFNHSLGSLSRISGMTNEFHIGCGLPYRNSRYDFGKRRYVGRKGGFSREYKHKSRRKNRRR
ncbi:MAG: PorP/SprF family type IX secretion system membrane protein [Crocinitomicaceae bacterium]|nr:PorP/SprF family type IX secretion system membrane protein [Crocinitomicaceae bacterium]